MIVTLESPNEAQFFLKANMFFKKSLPFAAKKYVTEISIRMMNAAIDHYEANKYTSNESKLIVGSFGLVMVGQGGEKHMRATVYAGGAAAPYAVYVDLGWNKNQEGQKGEFGGHHFMQEGFDTGVRETPMIVAKTLAASLISFKSN